MFVGNLKSVIFEYQNKGNKKNTYFSYLKY